MTCEEVKTRGMGLREAVPVSYLQRQDIQPLFEFPDSATRELSAAETNTLLF